MSTIEKISTQNGVQQEGIALSRNFGRFRIAFDTEIGGNIAEISQVTNQLLDFLESESCSSEVFFAIRFAFEEALVNAIRHGNRFSLTKKVYVHAEIFDRFLRIEITDEGDGFQVDRIGDPTQGECLYKPFGRGICLMRLFMNKVEYNKKGNSVLLEKELF